MQTQITNTSGAQRHFGWIPPHGRTLENNEQILLNGDIRSVLASGMNRYNRARELQGLDTDEANGDVNITEIVNGSSSGLA